MQSLLGLEHTSGTTGQALDLWWSRATVSVWYDETLAGATNRPMAV